MDEVEVEVVCLKVGERPPDGGLRLLPPVVDRRQLGTEDRKESIKVVQITINFEF